MIIQSHLKDLDAFAYSRFQAKLTHEEFQAFLTTIETKSQPLSDKLKDL
jgi:hypothetical protein